MKKYIHAIKSYLRTIYNLFKYKQNIFIFVKKDKTFGLTYFNMNEIEARQFLYAAFDHFAYKHIAQIEIDEMTK